MADLSGQRFGRLTALCREGANANRESYWRCVCDCGGTSRPLHGTLTKGAARSCGCLQQEVRRAHRKDFTGLRSGGLLAEKNTGRKDQRGSFLWLCRCDCGATKEVAGSSLKAGIVISCGCARRTRIAVRDPAIRSDRLERQNERRALTLQAEGSFTEAEVGQLHAKQRGRCIYCRTKLGDRFHRDHIEPLARGGSNYITNIQLLCPSCNARKRSTDPLLFAAKQGLLV